jgi:hypothetical protein
MGKDTTTAKQITCHVCTHYCITLQGRPACYLPWMENEAHEITPKQIKEAWTCNNFWKKKE